jgi:PAS domain S-box-containing protein
MKIALPESSFLLSAINGLAESSTGLDVLDNLRQSLHSHLPFEHAFIVIDAGDGSLIALTGTDPMFINTRWSFAEEFSCVVDKSCQLIAKASKHFAFIVQSKLIQQVSHSVLLIGVNNKSSRGAIVLLSSQNSVFDPDSLTIATALQPLFKQAFVQVEYMERLTRLVDEQTNALQESERRFRSFAELSSDWFWETDKDLKYQFLPSTENRYHYQYQHFVGRTPLDMRSEEEVLHLKKWSHFLRMTNRFEVFHNFEYEAVDKDGSSFWISISGTPKFDQYEQFIGYVGTGRDITYGKQRELELNQAKLEAEKANKAKSSFIAVTSHELRTPLNVVLGMIKLLEDTGLNIEQKSLVKYIQSSSKILDTLISDILDISRIESESLVLEKVRLNPRYLVNNIARQFQPQADDKFLDLTVEISDSVSDFVVGDITRISQVLFNLVGNAIKFTDSGQVIIRLKSDEDHLRFMIIDTGIGFSSENHEKIFEPFEQLDLSSHRRHQGVGLGLSIAKKLVEFMGGEITCKSTPNVGSIFSFNVPVEACLSADIIERNSEGQLSNEVRSLRILVAEDHPANQVFIKALLEKRGHIVSLVASGVEVLKSLVDGQFDVILMDIMMPEMDGLEATRIIRKSKEYEYLPIIALTANAGVEDKKLCLSAGMNDFLTKPLNFDDLQSTLSKWAR